MTPQRLENSIQIYNEQDVKYVLASLALASERTRCELKHPNNIIRDVFQEFSSMSAKDISEALKNGSLGLYGKTYKLSTQEVCIWIREYKKELDKKEKLKNYENPYKGQY